MQSYPSPNTMAAEGVPPFYSQSPSQQSQSTGLTHPDLQLIAQHSQSRTLAPSMNAGPGGILSETQDPRGQHQYHQDQTQPHAAAAHLQASPAQMGPVPGQYDSSPDASNRKRSKVSRACDECRRKKIRCDATEESGDTPCTSCKRIGSRCQFSRVPMKRGPSKGQWANDRGSRRSYIKELADRVQNLEGSLQVQQGGEVSTQQYFQHDSPQQQRASEEFSPPDDSMQRKRTYSAVSGDLGTTYQPQRPATGWASQELPRHLPHPPNAFPASHSAPATTTTVFREPNYSPNGLQPSPYWRTAPEPVRRQSSSFESLPQTDHSHHERVTDWDESIVDGYYNIIHPTYPLLALSKNKVRSMIAQCPTTLREAFYESLYAAVRSFPTPSAPTPEQQSSRKAAQLIIASEFENAADRTSTTNLVYLQVMLLMAIEADNCDPSQAQSGPSQSFWLGSAVELAYSMKLYTQKRLERQSINDPDSDESNARRIWWSLVMMDRWHAAIIGCPLLVPDTSVVVFQDDQAVLGESLYDLARLIIILGHVTLAPTDLSDPFNPSSSYFRTLLRGELERYRESLSASSLPPPNAPVVMYLSYWSLRILMARKLPEYGPHDLCEPATKIVTLLKNNPSLVCPLTHYANTFAAAALIECTAHEQTRMEAESGLTTLLDSRIAPSGWDASIRELIVKNKHLGQSTGAGGAAGAKAGTSQHSTGEESHLRSLAEAAELATATNEGKAESLAGGVRKESSTDGKIIRRFHDLREIVRSGLLGGSADR
ncbi:putative transcriptional regulatory [Hyphodiscus hymeniophilus]|uniref:Transcriptional regulatory n=1 Tax=Hyphodiscus hymeniophilus TaxID=353542 RepID=A0A9P6SNK1_9HELO|nr:putative transcriptional regulatory [Hyphodiscus hymeniophilus]